jgi:predicted RNase H-like nuclease
MTNTMDLIGVDGTSSGWIASIGNSRDKLLSTIKFSEDLNKLLLDYPDSIVVIDMPIELNKNKYLRKCDILAKKYLGKEFQSSIFIPPLKRVLECNTYKEANELSKKIAGKGLSKQSWHLKSKISEVQQISKLSNKIYEGHPECSFKMLKNETLKAKKKSVSGIFERLDLLKRVGLDPLSVNLNLENNSSIKIDDVLDSMVLFMTALRIVEGTYLCLEKTEITDGDNNGKIFI